MPEPYRLDAMIKHCDEKAQEHCGTQCGVEHEELLLALLDLKKRKEEIARLRELLEAIEKRCDSIDSDCHEGDKVMCHSQWIRCEIAKVYPKYTREERGNGE